APRAQIEAEERGDEHAVVGAEARAPEDARVRLADPLPVLPPDAEHGRATRRAARAVDARDLAGLDAQVLGVRRGRGLRGPEAGLLGDGTLPQVVEAGERGRGHSRRLPLPPVAPAPPPRPLHLA